MANESMRTSDVAVGGETTFDPWPQQCQVHVEWGVPGALLAARRRDLVVIVDVLSFSTSVVEATAGGGIAFCYSPGEIDEAGGRDAVARRHDAAVLSKDRRVAPGDVSLSPASLQGLPGDARVVMTSLNGGRCVGASAEAPWIGIGCLTNRSAVADRVAELIRDGVGSRCTVVPCAEVWSGFMAASVGDASELVDGQTRPSYEDLLGAGAIISALGKSVRRSVEAEMAAALFAAHAQDVAGYLSHCLSGRELIERDFAADVDIASRLDAHSCVPEHLSSDEPKVFRHRRA